MIQSKDTSSTQNWRAKYGFVYVYSFVMLGNIIISLGPLIPIKAKAGGNQETDYSVVFTFRAIGYVSGSFLMSKLEKKYDAHLMMTIASLGVAILCFLNIWETNIILNGIQWFFIGVGCSTIEVLAQVSITVIYTEEVNFWMQALHFGFGIGAFISPLIIVAIGGHVMIVLGVLALINAALIYQKTSPKIQNLQGGSTQEISDRQQTPTGLVRVLTAFFFLDVGIELSYGGWIPTFCTTTGITNQQQAGISASIFWVTMTVGRLLALPLANKFKVHNQLKVLSYSVFGVFCFCMLMLILNDLKTLVYLGSALAGLSLSAVYPLLMSIPGAFGFYLSASNAAIFTVFGSSGEAVLPMLIGFLMNLFGSSMLFVSCLMISMSIVVLLWEVTKYKPKDKDKAKSLEMKLIQN